MNKQSLVVQIIPSRHTSRDIVALETVMQSLALDDRHPVALEIARTKKGRQLLLRASTPTALEHLADQVQARYPQAEIRSITEDPLQLQSGETASVVELHPGAASYLPLRSWREREFLGEGIDPLLGLLAALNHVPEEMRVVAQLALVPLAPTWSQRARRRAVEHPLEPERKDERRARSSSGAHVPSTPVLVGLAVLVACLLLWRGYAHQIRQIIPAWVVQAGTQLLKGQNPHLTLSEDVQLIGFVLVILVLVLLVTILLRFFGFGATQIYDMRLVDEKTRKSAYRVRLRLYVIGTPQVTGRASIPASLFAWPSYLAPLSTLLLRLYELVPAHLRTRYEQWRKTAKHEHQQSQARQVVLDHLAAAYRQYHLASGGYFVPHRVSRSATQRLLIHRTGLLRRFTGWEWNVRWSRHLLSVADLAGLWHLPQESDLPDLPLVERGRARTFLAPIELTTGHGWQLGTSNHAGHSLPVSLPREELRHNLLAVASTGKGKSTLFLHLAQAALSGETEKDGLMVIEPHRELIEALTGLIPPGRQGDVVLVDLADQAFPTGINPLDATLGRSRDKTVDNLIVIFERLWSYSWGTRTENVLEFSLKTLAAANETIVHTDPQHGPDRQYTLLDVVPLLRYISFRHSVLAQVSDPALISWWQLYYEPIDLRFQTEVISSVVNKLSKFSSSLVTRRILGQPRSSIDLSTIVREGKILLVSTASGVVGADIAALVGATLLGLFQVSLSEQAQVQAEQRRRFLVLVDEFQVFNGADYQTMLAELRKYGGSFGLATQSLAYLDKLDRTLRQTVLSNIDHLFAFDMAADDARLLEHELDGIEADDITNLDDYSCYAKLSLQGRRLPAFSLALLPPQTGDKLQAQNIRTRSQERYARPVAQVDTQILQAFQRHAPLDRRNQPGIDNANNQREEDNTNAHNSASPEQIQSSTETKKSPRQKRRGGTGGRSKGTTATEEDALSKHIIYDQDDRAGRIDTGEGGDEGEHS